MRSQLRESDMRMVNILDAYGHRVGGAPLYQDEFLDMMGDYFQTRNDLHGRITFEQFLYAPIRYQWIPPIE